MRVEEEANSFVFKFQPFNFTVASCVLGLLEKFRSEIIKPFYQNIIFLILTYFFALICLNWFDECKTGRHSV